MPTEKSKISLDTQITFTLKGFMGTIVSILVIFVGFHKMVIVPTLDSHQKKMEFIEKEHRETFKDLTDKVIELSNGIGTLNGNIEGINNRFKDINGNSHVEEAGGFTR